jgi:hypothetical protein
MYDDQQRHSGGVAGLHRSTRRHLLGASAVAMLLGRGSAAPAAKAPAAIDVREAVLCSWIFDLEQGAPPPFGFTLVDIHRDEAAGHLSALLRTRMPDGEEEDRLVNRGTRVEQGSIGRLLSALREDMGANLAVLLGRREVAMAEAALRAVASVARRPGGRRLRLLGQSLGGGLAQLQAAWCHVHRPDRPLARFATFAASDIASLAERRVGAQLSTLPPELGDNWVSPRDLLTGPYAPLGAPRLGTTHIVRDMRGPPLAWPGLAYHRAGAWVNHGAGRRVDDDPPAHPASAADWQRLARAGCSLPEGWPGG